jgi:EAL domain-containing protein (putative c-di-GMP-specific phosphodiesterase class I)/GGDEF domain-containing protein
MTKPPERSLGKADARVGDLGRFLAFSFASADVLIETDHELHVAFCSGATRSLIGVDTDALIGRSLLDRLAGHDRVLVRVLLQGLANHARIEPVLVQLAEEAELGSSIVLAAYRMDGDHPHYYLTLSRARLATIAQAVAGKRDSATGLLQPDAFAEVAAQRMEAAERMGQDTRLTLLRLEKLDGLLKSVEPEQADALLGEIGAALRMAAVDGSAAGRLAADRYGVLHAANLNAQDIGKNIEAIGKRHDPSGKGIAVTPSSVDTASAALSPEDRVKVVLYVIQRYSEAKAQSFEIANLTDAFSKLLDHTTAQVTQLKDTVAKGSVGLALQPIVDLSTRRTHHYEALARFPDGGSTGTSVQLAERIGFSSDLDMLVLQLAIEMLDKLPAIGGRKPDVAINISAPSIGSEVFVQAFRRLTAPLGKRRSQLIIEVTESTQIRDLDAANAVLQRLRQDGHRVCLDDFGAGAASFPYIQALTVDFVKIDGAYVKQVMSSPRDEAILKAMVGLCDDLDVDTIAEMVETNEQAQKLLAIGVRFGQGYLFGRPTLDVGSSEVASPVRPARRKGATESWS